jgi:hypothetical protein
MSGAHRPRTASVMTASQPFCSISLRALATETAGPTTWRLSQLLGDIESQRGVILVPGGISRASGFDADFDFLDLFEGIFGMSGGGTFHAGPPPAVQLPGDRAANSDHFPNAINIRMRDAQEV